MAPAPEHRLAERAGLPEHLRILLADYPRKSWPGHANFAGMTQFWLERHLMFRDIVDRLRTGTEARIDNALDHAVYQPRLRRLGNLLINQLHGHHQIEDQHDFPQMARIEPRVAAAFEILDADHVELDRRIHDFAEAANRVLQPDAPSPRTGSRKEDARDAVGRFGENLGVLERLLDRHLVDEEEIVVPVLLRFG